MKKPRAQRRRLNYTKRFVAFLKHPLFWILTAAGNGMIVLGSLLLFILESKTDSSIRFIDCLTWSTSIVTTVGYVAYTPVTFWGKVTVIILMIFSTFFIWSYMAFLVTALVSPALNSIEKEMQDFERELTELKSDELKTTRDIP